MLFVVVYRGVVDIRQLVGLYRVGDYRVGNAGLGAIETQIEAFEYVLQRVRYAFQQVFVVCKNLVIITIAQNFVTFGNTVTFQSLAQQHVRVTQDNLGNDVVQGAALRQSDVATLAKHGQDAHNVRLDVDFGCRALAAKSFFDRLQFDSAVAIGNIRDKHIAIVQRQLDGHLFETIPPVQNGCGLMEILLIGRDDGDAYGLNMRRGAKDLEVVKYRSPVLRGANLACQQIIQERIGQRQHAHCITAVLIEHNVIIGIGHILGVDVLQTFVDGGIGNMLACKRQYGVKIEILRHLGRDIPVVLHQEIEGFVCTEVKNCLNFHIVISV